MSQELKTKDTAPEPRREEVNDSNYRQDNYHKTYKRKKTFLEEIFD